MVSPRGSLVVHVVGARCWSAYSQLSWRFAALLGRTRRSRRAENDSLLRPSAACTRAQLLNPSPVFGATMLLGDVAPTLTTPPQGLPHASSRLSQVYWYYIHLPQPWTRLIRRSAAVQPPGARSSSAIDTSRGGNFRDSGLKIPGDNTHLLHRILSAHVLGWSEPEGCSPAPRNRPSRAGVPQSWG